MREKQKNPELFDQYSRDIAWETFKNPLAKKLNQIDRLLDEIPQVLVQVVVDLNAHLNNSKPTKPGRKADITAEQALRTAILKQLRGFSYRILASEIDITPIYRKFTRFYGAGIEGNLSTLLRSFGLGRCLWKGWESFKAYTGLGIATYNLRLLAGHLAKV